MVETKTLTIPLTEVPVGAPDFRFAAYSPPLNMREIFPLKSEYDAGEIVYVHYAVKNVGTAEGIGQVVISDADTGKLVTAYPTPKLGVGSKFKTSVGVRVGAMPDRDWRLSFKVTP